MRFREPLLYEQYIGQYLSDEEILQQSMQNGPIGLSDLLMNSYQEKELQKRMQEEQGREKYANQEEEEEEEGEFIEPSAVLTNWGINGISTRGHVMTQTTLTDRFPSRPVNFSLPSGLSWFLQSAFSCWLCFFTP